MSRSLRSRLGGSLMKRMGRIRTTTTLMLVLAGIAPGLPTAVAEGSSGGAADRTPVVLFPAFHFTKLAVTVRDQEVAPGCPRSGSFEDWFLNDHPSSTFSPSVPGQAPDSALLRGYRRSR